MVNRIGPVGHVKIFVNKLVRFRGRRRIDFGQHFVIFQEMVGPVSEAAFLGIGVAEFRITVGPSDRRVVFAVIFRIISVFDQYLVEGLFVGDIEGCGILAHETICADAMVIHEQSREN